MNKTIQNKGITLVALVITIIILLILAGVSISTLTGNGLFARAQEANEKTKKAQYEEEISYVIMEEQIERSENEKEESFITSIKLKIDKKDWVSNTLMYDKDGQEQTGEYIKLNNQLIIETKDGYEIYVDVDNENNIAKIRTDSFKKIEKECTVTYDNNGGTGNIEGQNIRKGFYITLPENIFIKADYSFIGWSTNKNAIEENDVVYVAGSKMKIEEDTVIYAIWKKDIVTITYDANGGDGLMVATTIGKNITTNLPQNTFTRTEYNFVGWKDENGVNYKDEDSINIDRDIILYAQWQIKTYTITYNSNGASSGTVESHTDCKKGDSIILRENEYIKDGFTFYGWSKTRNINNENDIIAAGTTVQVDRDTTYYAVWKLTEVSGKTIEYKGYYFIIYGTNEDGKYLAKPTGTCGTYTGYSGSEVEDYVDTTFGTEGKVTAKLFSFTTAEANIIKSYGLTSNDDVWMIYQNVARPLNGTTTGWTSTSGKTTAYVIPKLIIEPYAITKSLNSSYLIIE